LAHGKVFLAVKILEGFVISENDEMGAEEIGSPLLESMDN